MAPFRTRADELDEGKSAPASEAVRDAVGAMVRQFADPLALLRELVQNGIDAEATRIDVRLGFDDEPDGDGGDGGRRSKEGELRISVIDDGHGMTLDVIERCLLTLFRSSKDGDKRKIGKFGVGFFSVFALEPSLVRVDTSTGAESFRVHVKSDFSYEVEQGSPRPRGTTVTLRVPASAGKARDLSRRSREALKRWCPHVEVALHAASTVHGAEFDERIDAPLGIDAPVCVVHRDEDGASYALAIGATEVGTSLLKRGILLHEGGDEVSPGVRARIDAPGLSHTLSRDDVRRDAAHEKVIGRARSLAHSRLRGAAIEGFNGAVARMAEAREKGARVDAGDEALLAHCAGFLAQRELRPDRAELRWPLLEATQKDRWSSEQAPQLFAREKSPLTEALARQGLGVLALGGGRTAEALAALLRAVQPGALDPHEHRCAPCVQPEGALTDDERALLRALGPLAKSVELAGVGLARPVGLGSDRLYFALTARQIEAPDAGLTLNASSVSASLFALIEARAVAFNASHPRVVKAARAARTDAPFAAAALLRSALLAEGKLSAKLDAALLDAAFVAGSS